MAGGVAVSQAMVQQQQTPAQLAQVRLGDIYDPQTLLCSDLTGQCLCNF
jgi:hypothetical protein